MRDLTKNLFNFSWAMSLYGARQLSQMLDPRQVAKGAPDAAKSLDQVTDVVVGQLGANLRQAFDAGAKVQGEIIDLVFGAAGFGSARCKPCGGGTGSVVPAVFAAHSSAGEEVLITYTRGQGTFSADKRFIALTNPIYNLDGTANGVHTGVWAALFQTPQDLLARPAPPPGTMLEPVGPVPAWPVSANTIARWQHADGSTIDSVGPAASHLIPLSDGSFLFLVITGQIITRGTGRFAGARGLTQSLGATWVPAGTNLFAPDASPNFPATTFDTFKLIRVGSAAGSGRRSGGSYSFDSQAARQSQPEPAVCVSATDSHASKFVEVLGSKMHYLETGSGEPVVFLHGNPVWSKIWEKVLPEVAPTARCIAPDLIGMGLSDKPAIEYSFFDHVRYLEGFLAALQLDRYTLVLHDWGSIVGFYLAMKHEKQVRGLAFSEAMLKPYGGWNEFPPPIAAQFQQFRDPEVGRRLIVEENMMVEKVLPASTMVPFSAAEMDCYRQPFPDAASRELILRFVSSLPVAGQPAEVARASQEYATWLRRTPLPKLFLWSEPGLISSRRDVEWARRNFKSLKTSFLGPGLHFHQQEHPVELGQEIARWLESLPGNDARGKTI